MNLLPLDEYEGDNGLLESTVSPYQEVLDALSSLITKRTRGDKSNKSVIFDVLFEYIKVNTDVKICVIFCNRVLYFS